MFLANSILFIYDYTTSDFFPRLQRLIGCSEVCIFFKSNGNAEEINNILTFIQYFRVKEEYK